MKHPLTSRERRGLLAVAAAALLCVASGFIFRNCSSRNSPASPPITAIDNDSIASLPSDSISEKDEASGKSGDSEHSGKSGRYRKSRDAGTSEGSGRSVRSRKKASPKTYPTRDPLDQPID